MYCGGATTIGGCGTTSHLPAPCPLPPQVPPPYVVALHRLVAVRRARNVDVVAPAAAVAAAAAATAAVIADITRTIGHAPVLTLSVRTELAVPTPSAGQPLATGPWTPHNATAAPVSHCHLPYNLSYAN